MDISIWEKESFYAPCDVLIVGGGFLGLWTARELKIKRPGIKVTLIDRSSVPEGASTRNAGFACFGSPSEMLHDLGVMPEQLMWRIVEMRYQGIQKIRATFPDDKTGFENSGGYECFYDMGREEWQQFEAGIEQLNAAMKFITKKPDAFSSVPGKLAGYGLRGFGHMLENRLEGGLHSGRLMQAMQGMVRQMGVNLLMHCEMDHYEIKGSRIIVTTKEGPNFTCGSLLLATNAWLSQQVPALGVKPARGQIMLSPPIAGLTLKGTFHFDSGYYYFRNLGNRVLIGGARNTDFKAEETLDMNTTPAIRRKLYGFLQKHLPATTAFPEDRFESWSGIMAMHPAKQPVLASVEEGVLAAMCCNGMGVALSPVFAESVAGAILDNLL